MTKAGRGDKRIQILRSAAAAFRKKGYHGASVAEIARALRMTKGSLYYYFRDKEDILFVLHDYSVDILLERLSEIAKGRAPADEKLRALVAAFVHMIIDEIHGTALTMDLEALAPRRLRRIVAKRDRFDHGMRRLVGEGIRSGVFRPVDAKLATFAILGSVNWITRWYDPKGSASSTQVAEAFADVLVRGLLARP